MLRRLLLTLALAARHAASALVDAECSGCNVVAYTLHARLGREELALHTPQTLHAAMESTCQSSGCGKKAGRCIRLMDNHGLTMAGQIKAEGLRDLLGTQRQLCGELAEVCPLSLFDPKPRDEL